MSPNAELVRCCGGTCGMLADFGGQQIAPGDASPVTEIRLRVIDLVWPMRVVR